MGALDRILTRIAPARQERAWPVGRAETYGWETTWGHDDWRFAPESNENYAVQNDVFTVLTARARLMSDIELNFYDHKGIRKKQITDHRAVELYDYVNPFWCVDDQTEALTARGWVSGEDLTTDDLILSMDPATGQLKWSTITAINRKRYSGPMHHIRRGPMDALVTPGHKFPLIDGRMVPVEDLRQGHAIRAMGSAVADDALGVSYSDAFVELVGWAVTEGSYVRTRSRTGRRGERPTYGDYRVRPTTVAISQKDGTEKCERIRLVLKEAGARWHESLAGVRRDIRTFGVTGEIAQAIMAVAPGRVLSPEFMLSLTATQRELLIDTMVSADGTRDRRYGGRRFYQRDKASADSFLMLCAMAGYTASYKLRTWKGGNHFGGDVWSIEVGREKTVRPRRRVPADEHYEGMVWCPATEYGTFVCRRAGRVYVTGNTRERLDRMDELCMGIWGESFWAIRPPSRESPLGEIWWLKPSRVYPLVHEYKYVSGYRYQGLTGEWLYFEPHEIVWFRYPNPLDEFSPLPPLIAAQLAADTSQAMVKANRQLFTQGLQIAGLVFPPNPDVVWTQEQVNGMEMFLRKKFTASEKANRWAVLRQEAKFQQISMSPRDAEFLGGLNTSFRQICRVFGMQATLLGDLEQASPGDTQNLERIEWARTLAPDAKLRASEMKEQYLPLFMHERGAPRHCEFDFSRVPAMQEAETAMWEREAGQVDRGLMTINEWRRRRGWPDVPWGEYPWMAMNKGMFVPDGEEPKGKVVIPGQDPSMFGFGGGGFGGGGFDDFGGGEAEGSNSADAGWPAQAQQGGPIQLDDNGVPAEVLPDDERNPLYNQERGWSHRAAVDYLASGEVREFLDWAFPEGFQVAGVKAVNGHRPGSALMR